MKDTFFHVFFDKTGGSNLNQNRKTPYIAPWRLPRVTVMRKDRMHISRAAVKFKLPS